MGPTYPPLATEIRATLLKLSDRQFDPEAKRSVLAWSEIPKAAEILRTLDICAFASLCSNFEMRVMDIVYKEACKNEGVSPADVVKIAEETWRKEPPYTP